jgi:hypothetical protein
MSSEDARMTSASPLPLSPTSPDIYVSKSTASFHLVHMISSILQERGFSNCEAGVLSSMENLLEGREWSLVKLRLPLYSLLTSFSTPRHRRPRRSLLIHSHPCRKCRQTPPITKRHHRTPLHHLPLPLLSRPPQLSQTPLFTFDSG